MRRSPESDEIAADGTLWPEHSRAALPTCESPFGRFPRHDHILRAELPIIDIVQNLENLAPPPLDVSVWDQRLPPKRPPPLRTIVFVAILPAIERRQAGL